MLGCTFCRSFQISVIIWTLAWSREPFKIEIICKHLKAKVYWVIFLRSLLVLDARHIGRKVRTFVIQGKSPACTLTRWSALSVLDGGRYGGWKRQYTSSDKAETSLRHLIGSPPMPTYLARTLWFCIKKQFWDSLDLRDFEGEWPILYVLFQENKTQAKRAITSVQHHTVFTSEQGWILKGSSELLNLLAGVILFLIVFKRIAFWALIKLIFSWSSDSNRPSALIASWTYS